MIDIQLKIIIKFINENTSILQFSTYVNFHKKRSILRKPIQIYFIEELQTTTIIIVCAAMLDLEKMFLLPKM